MGNKHKRLEEQDKFKVVLKDIESDDVFNTFYNELTSRNSDNRDKKNYVNSDLTCPCGKETYATRQDAENALKQRKNQNKRTYRCTICGHFHLTSNKRRDDKQKSNNYAKMLHNNRAKKVNTDILDNNEMFKKQIHKIANEKNHDKHKNLKVSQDSTNRTNIHKLSGFTLKEILTEKFVNNG